MRTKLLTALLACLVTQARAAEIVVYGAGSLREAVGQVAAAWGNAHGVAVRTDFGPSGRMRERIEAGESVDLFTSADIGHAAKLVADGRAQVLAMFARNSLCVLAPATAGLAPDRLLELLLDPPLRFGISPARVDPLGDYTELLFRRAETVRPGAEASLRARAVVLDAPSGAPATRSGDITTDAFQDGRIGAAIVYCSGKARYARLLPGTAMLPFPPTLEVGPEYGLAVLGTRPEAMSLALALLSPEGQRTLAAWGFTPVTLPMP